MENNTKQVLINLLTNNLIEGRITTEPFYNSDDKIQFDSSFDEVTTTDNIAFLYDTDKNTRAELTGMFKLPLNAIDEAHFTDDVCELGDLYGKYNILIYLESGSEILLTFRMKDANRTPFFLDNEDMLQFEYTGMALDQLDYFVDKPVKLNFSASSYSSTYDPDNCNYANPVFATMEIESFQCTYKKVENIPCVIITDKANESTRLVLNAIDHVAECNIGDSDKRIFSLSTEIGLVSVMDRGYVFAREVA